MTTAAGELVPQALSHSNFGIETSPSDDELLAFVRVRPRLFAIAYRMLRSAAEAEDIVQDVWLRWQTANRSGVLDPQTFLATTTRRLCINRSQSARCRRETYVGPGLPEPVDTAPDPFLSAERSEALKIAVLMLLKKLSPTERAAYVLREAFHYSYRQIANLIHMEEANARQLVTRARKHIADARHLWLSAACHGGPLAAWEGANLPAFCNECKTPLC